MEEIDYKSAYLALARHNVELVDKVETLEETISSKDETISDQWSIISDLESEIMELQTTVSALREEQAEVPSRDRELIIDIFNMINNHMNQ